MVGRILYRDAALADATGPELKTGVSVLVEDGRVAWIRPTENELAENLGAKVVDAGGATIVPGLVDGHSHVTLPGGSHWIARGSDPPERLLEEAELNGDLLNHAGVRWARDVGSVTAADPHDGRQRALTLGLRDRWRHRLDRPYIRAAGTWVTRTGSLPAGLSVSADDPDTMFALAQRQLDDGADLIKLYLDGPKPDEAPWSIEEVRRVVEMAHTRKVKVTAHSSTLVGARVGVGAGVDSIEHGFTLDDEVARRMATQGTFLVTTLAVFRSWATFARTTTIPGFVSDEKRAAISRRREAAVESVHCAQRAGVRIAAGTDFGGGSLRANQLAWEVESLVDAGLAPWEALAAVTRRGGELLGEPEAGVIREGGPADFFLVHGDPLSDPSALWRVWRVAWGAEVGSVPTPVSAR